MTEVSSNNQIYTQTNCTKERCFNKQQFVETCQGLGLRINDDGRIAEEEVSAEEEEQNKTVLNLKKFVYCWKYQQSEFNIDGCSVNALLAIFCPFSRCWYVLLQGFAGLGLSRSRDLLDHNAVLETTFQPSRRLGCFGTRGIHRFWFHHCVHWYFSDICRERARKATLRNEFTRTSVTTQEKSGTRTPIGNTSAAYFLSFNTLF